MPINVRFIDGTEKTYRDAEYCYSTAGLFVLKRRRGRQEEEVAVLNSDGITLAEVFNANGVLKNIVLGSGTAKPRGESMADKAKNCPQCEKNGKTVAMKMDKRARPNQAMFVADDMWVCPECKHAEPVAD